MTYYATLGVKPGASSTDIKRAYRRLAMAWHPDRNNHPDATERFKQIRAAYDALTTPDAAPVETAASPASDEVERAADIRLNLEISLAQAWAGCFVDLHYQRGSACVTCDGSGEHGMTRTRFCKECHGSGRIRDKAKGLVSCEACLGRGFFSERICPDCHGSGRDSADVSLQIKVPPGMLPGDDLRLVGQGEPGNERLQAGDLFLTIVIHSHPVFTLRNRDIHLEMPVNALSLIAGSRIEVPLPVGTLALELDPGAASGRTLRLPGKGYPGRGKAGAGDLVVDLKPVFPVRLNARQRKMAQQLVEALDLDADACLPDVADWWRTLRAEGSAEN